MQCIYMYQVVGGSGPYCALTLIWYNRKLHEINNPKQLRQLLHIFFVPFPTYRTLSRFVFVTISSIAFKLLSRYISL